MSYNTSPSHSLRVASQPGVLISYNVHTHTIHCIQYSTTLTQMFASTLSSSSSGGATERSVVISYPDWERCPTIADFCEVSALYCCESRAKESRSPNFAASACDNPLVVRSSFPSR